MGLVEIINEVSDIFEEHGYKIYAVGGTVRDFLLEREIHDYDFVTDATPEEMKLFLDNYNDVFAKYGVMIYKHKGIKIEITTLRKESSYNDSRHPGKIQFVKNLEEDYLRRDFTINALYMDKNKKIYDFCDGLNDLKQKEIRVIGDIDKRMKEDPLRILRALRFSLVLNFKLDDALDSYIQNNIDLLNKLNPNKICEEITKMQKINSVGTQDILLKYGINLFNNQ